MHEVGHVKRWGPPGIDAEIEAWKYALGRIRPRFRPAIAPIVMYSIGSYLIDKPITRIVEVLEFFANCLNITQNEAYRLFLLALDKFLAGENRTYLHELLNTPAGAETPSQ